MVGRLRASTALTAIANRGYSVALVVLVYKATGSPSWVAAAAASRYLSGLVAGALSGPVAMRFRPSAVLVWTDALGAAALVAMAVTGLAGTSALAAVALGALVRAIAALQAASCAVLLTDVTVGGDIAEASARQNAVEKLALFGGPALGGVLLLAISPGVELAILAACLAAAALLTADVGGSRGPAIPLSVVPARAGERPAPRAERVAPRGAATVFVAFSVVAALVYGTDTVILAVLGHDRLGLGDAGYGLLFGALGVGTLLSSPLIPRVSRSDRLATVLAAATAAYCLPTALLATTSSSAAAMALEVLRGSAALLVEVLAVTGLQRTVLPREIPAAIGATTAAVMGAVAVGAIVTPAMIDAFGLRATLVADGVAIPALAVVTLPFLREVDRDAERRRRELAPRTDVLARLGLFAATSRPVLERMAAGLLEIDVPAGDVVVAEGDPADAFYVLVEGHAVVTGADGDGAQRRLNTLSSGDWFGEIGLLMARPRTATVTTTEPSHLFRVDAADFLDAFAQLPPSAGLIEGANTRLLATGQADGRERAPATAEG